MGSSGLFLAVIIVQEGVFLLNRGRNITQEEILAPLCGILWATSKEEEPHVAHFS